MNKPVTVVIAGGGTGGHLFPGIAVARELLRRMPAARVSFAGTARGLEARVVPKEGFELDLIRSAGLKGKSIVGRARGVALVPVGLVDAWRVVARRRPDVVMGVGGYSSGPVVLAAALRGVPSLVLEQNAVPGLTNRMLAPWVRSVAVTFDETLAFFRGKGFVSGNPVRSEFFERSKSEVRRLDSALRTSDSHTVLVLGGSQGAHAINVAVLAAAPLLARRGVTVVLVHQTGERDLATVAAAYERAGVSARTASFLDDVAGEMAAADLVVSRAGATTLAELAAAGCPAVLIPFPGATDDHQRRNAEVLVRAGAAALVDERELTPDRLADVATGLLQDADRRAHMAQAMRAMARPDAAARIVDRLLELASPPERQAA